MRVEDGGGGFLKTSGKIFATRGLYPVGLAQLDKTLWAQFFNF